MFTLWSQLIYITHIIFIISFNFSFPCIWREVKLTIGLSTSTCWIIDSWKKITKQSGLAFLHKLTKIKIKNYHLLHTILINIFSKASIQNATIYSSKSTSRIPGFSITIPIILRFRADRLIAFSFPSASNQGRMGTISTRPSCAFPGK